jgi:branched-chain amino acid transport system permease protein
MIEFLQSSGIFVLTFAILALSYNLIFGYLGVTSLAHAAFWGVGAYASALTATRLGWPWPAGMAVGFVAAALIGALVAIPAARLRGDYLLIATIGFQVILHSLFLNWRSVTNGPLGIRRIPRPMVLDFLVQSQSAYIAFGFGLFLVVLFITWRLSQSPFGRMLKAVRDDDIAAQSLGKDVVRVKVITFAISSGIAAISGSLLAIRVTYIDPESFVLLNSFFVLTIVAVGGAGNFLGSVAGAIFIVGLPEILRLVDLPNGVVGPLRQIIVGVVLVAFMLFRPQGLVPEHWRSRRDETPRTQVYESDRVEV